MAPAYPPESKTHNVLKPIKLVLPSCEIPIIQKAQAIPSCCEKLVKILLHLLLFLMALLSWKSVCQLQSFDNWLESVQHSASKTLIPEKRLLKCYFVSGIKNSDCWLKNHVLAKSKIYKWRLFMCTGKDVHTQSHFFFIFMFGRIWSTYDHIIHFHISFTIT